MFKAKAKVVFANEKDEKREPRATFDEKGVKSVPVYSAARSVPKPVVPDPTKSASTRQQDKGAERARATMLNNSLSNIPSLGSDIAMQISTFSAEDIAHFPVINSEEEVRQLMDNKRIEKLKKTGATAKIKEKPLAATADIFESQLMGRSEMNTPCIACQDPDCFGHYGKLYMHGHFYNIIMAKTIVDTLNCVCDICGELLAVGKKKFDEFKRQADGWNISRSEIKMKRMLKISPGEAELHYASAHPEIAKNKSRPVFSCAKFKTSWTINKKLTSQTGAGIPILEAEVAKIFAKIKDDRAELLGFSSGSHPKNLVSEYLVVIPPYMRPAVRSVTGMATKDYLTLKYATILSRLETFRQATTGGEVKEKKNNIDPRKAVYEAISELVEGKTGDAASARSIRQRMSKKEGHVRKYMTGKRVDFCARSVVGPDPSIAVDEVGIPLAFAPILTVEVVVTNYNMQSCKELLRAGKVEYIVRGKPLSGGNSLKQRVVKEKAARDEYRLSLGDVVMRHLRNGDRVILNRQPTLHKQSMMSHKVVLKDQKNISLHQSVAKSYNYDNDGDEMNIHVVQTIEGMVEQSEVIAVDKCIISTHDNAPIIALAFNSITALYLISTWKVPTNTAQLMKDNKLFSSLINAVKIGLRSTNQLATLSRRMKELGIEQGGNRELLSLIFPPDFNYEHRGVLIVNGVYITGTIDKRISGAAARSFVQDMWARYTPDRCIQFITDGAFLSNTYMAIFGFSIGAKDCVGAEPSTKTLKEMREMIDLIEKTETKIAEVKGNNLHQNAIREDLEKVVNVATMQISNILMNDVKNTSDTNSMQSMIIGGAKGSESNKMQILRAVGQQNFAGKPVFSKEETNAWFEKGKANIIAKGFCPNSFVKGLCQQEFVSIMAAGREGTMDTAIKTAEIGNLHRKLNRATQNLIVSYSGSVINHMGVVYSFLYGDNNLSVEHSVASGVTGKPHATAYMDFQTLADNISAEEGWVKDGGRLPQLHFVKGIHTVADFFKLEAYKAGLENKENPVTQAIAYINNFFSFAKLITEDTSVDELVNLYSRLRMNEGCFTRSTPAFYHRHILSYLHQFISTQEMGKSSLLDYSASMGNNAFYFSRLFNKVLINNAGDADSTLLSVAENNLAVFGITNCERWNAKDKAEVVYIDVNEENYDVVQKDYFFPLPLLRGEEDKDEKNKVKKEYVADVVKRFSESKVIMIKHVHPLSYVSRTHTLYKAFAGEDPKGEVFARYSFVTAKGEKIVIDENKEVKLDDVATWNPINNYKSM